MAQRGNILFLILLAIILFVALTYAVNSGMRGGGNSAAKESNDSLAAELINNGALMKATSDRLRLVNGCSETDISLCTGTTYYPGWCGAKNECRLFYSSGGNLMSIRLPNINFVGGTVHATQSKPPNTNTFWTASSQHAIPNIGTALPDLIVFAFDIKKDLCQAVNNAAGIASIPNLPSSNSRPWWMTWGGAYATTPAVTLATSDSYMTLPTAFSGKEFGCFYSSNDGGYYDFFYVLIPR